MCLFTSLASLAYYHTNGEIKIYNVYSFRLPLEGWLKLSRPGCLVLRQGGLPVQRRSPIQALTGPGVE